MSCNNSFFYNFLGGGLVATHRTLFRKLPPSPVFNISFSPQLQCEISPWQQWTRCRWVSINDARDCCGSGIWVFIWLQVWVQHLGFSTRSSGPARPRLGFLSAHAHLVLQSTRWNQTGTQVSPEKHLRFTITQLKKPSSTQQHLLFKHTLYVVNDRIKATRFQQNSHNYGIQLRNA